MKRLPNKPSKLLKLALKDLEKCEKDSRYTIDMNVFHLPNKNKCRVCLAGAMLAKSVGYNPQKDTFAVRKEKIHIIDKVFAINRLRRGVVSLAFLFFTGIPGDITKFNRQMPEYSDNPQLFKKHVLELAEDLEKAGY